MTAWLAITALLAAAAIPMFWPRRWTRRALDVAIVISAALLIFNPAWFASEDSLVLATPPSAMGDIVWDGAAGGIASPAQIPFRDTRTEARVAGAGMPLASWLENPRITPVPEVDGPGTSSWSWPQTATVGEPIVIEGPSLQSVRIALAGAGAFDLAKPENGRVRFTFVPKIAGRVEYRLSGPGWEEVIGIYVQPRPPLRFAMEFSRPNFESNGLKRYLAALQADGVVSWQIAPQIARTESVNKGASADDLDTLDLWAGDAEQFRLRRDELLKASQGGLGVLILVNELPQSDLPMAITERAAAGEVVLWLDDPAAIPASEETRGRFGYVTRGDGRLGISLLEDTFRIITSDGMDAYAALWSDLLQALLRPVPAAMHHQSDEALPLVRSAVLTCSPAPSGAPIIAPTPALMLDAGRHRGHSCIRWWPRMAGWHSLTSDNQGQALRVYARDEWRPKISDQRRRHTAAASVLSGGENTGLGGNQTNPSIWLTLLLFLSIASWLLGLRTRSVQQAR